MSDRKLYIGTNLKMYKDAKDTCSYLQQLQELTKGYVSDGLTLFVIPSYTSLPAAYSLHLNSIMLGAQNMCWAEKGQYTGEISPLMLKELNIDLVEIGHSERRWVFHETNDMIHKKVMAALEHGFRTLLCIGETFEDMTQEIGAEALKIQIKTALKDVPQDCTDRIWVAYEPVWSIGESGIPATPEYVNSKINDIRSTLIQQFPSANSTIPVLYGGSVNMDNACDFIEKAGIDGLFVGRAAWEAAGFEKLIGKVIKTWGKVVGNLA